MTAKKQLRKLRLSENDLSEIKEAVQRTEVRTNGEIAIAATEESSDYSFYELFASVVLGAIAFAVMLPLYQPIETFLDRLFWQTNNWFVPAFYGAVSFALIAFFFFMANIPAIDRILIPRSVRTARVYNRAIRHFAESGVYSTKEHTGILIFISLMEREVRIVADTGINEKIEQAEWDSIAQSIAEGIREGETSLAIIAAVERCGDLLERHFPAQKENPNELPDGIIILEAGE